jgi:hypothetical protein
VRKLCDVKGISEAKVLKLKEIVKSMVPMDFKTAADALEDRKYVFFLNSRMCTGIYIPINVILFYLPKFLLYLFT